MDENIGKDLISSFFSFLSQVLVYLYIYIYMVIYIYGQYSISYAFQLYNILNPARKNNQFAVQSDFSFFNEQYIKLNARIKTHGHTYASPLKRAYPLNHKVWFQLKVATPPESHKRDAASNYQPHYEDKRRRR